MVRCINGKNYWQGEDNAKCGCCRWVRWLAGEPNNEGTAPVVFQCVNKDSVLYRVTRYAEYADQSHVCMGFRKKFWDAHRPKTSDGLPKVVNKLMEEQGVIPTRDQGGVKNIPTAPKLEKKVIKLYTIEQKKDVELCLPLGAEVVEYKYEYGEFCIVVIQEASEFIRPTERIRFHVCLLGQKYNDKEHDWQYIGSASNRDCIMRIDSFLFKETDTDKE